MSFKTNYKRPEWTAALAAMICGCVTHLFGLATVLHNNDDIGQQPYGYGTGITSGRWLLSVLGDIVGENGGNYNLPFVNGLIYLGLLALCAGLLVSTLHIKNRKLAALVGLLFVTFPSAAATMFFRYTVVYYGIAMFLAIFAVWILERHRFGLLFSVLCIACSLGIYQAYIPTTIGLFVLLLLKHTLENQTNVWGLIRKGLYDCVVLMLGLLTYYLLLNLFLVLYGTELSNYNGVNNMGNLAFSDIPGLIKEAVYAFGTLPLKNYCGLANMKWIRICYILLAAVSLALLAYVLFVRIKKISLIFFAGLLCCLFPIAVNFVVIMCPDGFIYTIMQYAFVLIGCVPVIILECLPIGNEQFDKGKALLEKTIAVILSVLVFCYAYDTNVNYMSCYYANRQTENYLNALIIQVRMTEGFDTEKEWAFIGNIEDPLFRNPWQYEIRIGGNEAAYSLVNRDTRYFWIQNYFGYTIPVASDEKIAQLSINEEVKSMPCWPNDGSIKIINDTIIIKCQDWQQ